MTRGYSPDCSCLYCAGKRSEAENRHVFIYGGPNGDSNWCSVCGEDENSPSHVDKKEEKAA